MRLTTPTLALAALVPAMAVAQAVPADPASDAWRYRATLYLYLPSVGGASSSPAGDSGIPIDIVLDHILENLQFAAMGSFDANNGHWGGFTDFVYIDFANTRHGSRDFTIGGQLPADASADLSWSLSGFAWTLGGEYRVSSDPAFTLDVLAGARVLDVTTTTSWAITGSLGPLPPAERSGRSERHPTLWDGIVGVKGRLAFGPSSRWSAPFYLDVGTGDSDLTWQAATGITYAFDWGEVSALWRYLDYQLKPGYGLTDLSFNGPMVGATWRW